MKPFEYVRPKSIAEAVAAAAEPGAAYLAGGTNLLDLMKGGVTRPDRLVDVTHLPGLDDIRQLPDALCALARSSATPRSLTTAILRGASLPSRKRFCPERRRSCGMQRRSAAI